MNKVILTNARLVREPNISVSQGASMTIARFTLAVDKNYKKSKDDVANFINCVAFGKTAEVVDRFCTKGTKINIEGEWVTGKYTDKDGNVVYTNDCNISKLEFCESRSASQNNANNQAPRATDSNGFMNIPDGFEDDGLPFA